MHDGADLDAVFEAYWPAYQKWMAKARSSAKAAREKLGEHMPELMPVYAALLARFGDRADIARFLTLYRPPPLVRGCTQAIWQGKDGPALVRNYDHAPHLTDGVVLRAEWEGVPTVCVTDCVFGALDGVNAHGLCVALAFGGRQVSGDGFAAPLLVRYALQTCTTAPEAAAAIARVPCYMTYTFVCLDASGAHATVYAAPDRPSRIDHATTSANHQGRVEWPQYAASCKTVERVHAARDLIDEPAQTLDGLVEGFLQPPIYRTGYAKGSGTLYTSVYTPDRGEVELRWPNARMRQSIDAFEPGSVEAALGTG
ncbi:MAG: C45 family autoproteolytic acyltransferase/hydrolase [Phycisphaerales bacterium JB060]